jgi:hypothetical protein
MWPLGDKADIPVALQNVRKSVVARLIEINAPIRNLDDPIVVAVFS